MSHPSILRRAPIRVACRTCGVAAGRSCAEEYAPLDLFCVTRMERSRRGMAVTRGVSWEGAAGPTLFDRRASAEAFAAGVYDD